MIKFNVSETKDTVIGKDMTERRVKLFSSPKSKIKTEPFALGMTVIEPGKSHEIHEHDANSEIQVIYSGIGLMISGGREVKIKKGDVIGLTVNEDHGFKNTGDTNLEILWIYYPPGLADEKFLTEEEEDSHGDFSR